jgi:hypothetical protein
MDIAHAAALLGRRGGLAGGRKGGLARAQRLAHLGESVKGRPSSIHFELRSAEP